MLLGDVIARFEDEAFVNETLLALDDLALTARVLTGAAENKVSAGEFAAQSVGQFVNGASDEEWLTLIGLMSRAENPGLGYTALAWPAYGWVAAALVLVTLMTVQGLGFLTPVNVLVCLEMQKSEPDMNRIGFWMRYYFYAVAMQGVMQIAILVVMTRFRTGI
jgi:hypothetical protein